MEVYTDEAQFDLSMMTHFRERLNLEMINRVNELVIENENKKKNRKKPGKTASEKKKLRVKANFFWMQHVYLKTYGIQQIYHY